jgi:hypothetical protein
VFDGECGGDGSIIQKVDWEGWLLFLKVWWDKFCGQVVPCAS